MFTESLHRTTLKFQCTHFAGDLRRHGFCDVQVRSGDGGGSDGTRHGSCRPHLGKVRQTHQTRVRKGKSCIHSERKQMRLCRYD